MITEPHFPFEDFAFRAGLGATRYYHPGKGYWTIHHRSLRVREDLVQPGIDAMESIVSVGMALSRGFAGTGGVRNRDASWYSSSSADNAGKRPRIQIPFG